MDVGSWLRQLGLEQYEPAFRENRIDRSILPSLTAEDLKDLGVVLVGDRRRLLNAIALLREQIKTPAAAEPLPQSSAPPPPTVAPVLAVTPAIELRGADRGGERRHLTVLFCDLVGSTAIASRLDAEEWRDLVAGYLDAAAAAVRKMDGHVAKLLGDGLMALFGYPTAHENDAERAVRAALSIQRALAELNRRQANKPQLTARIGIETGPVVVDAAGEIFGDAPNIAARIQAMAEPGAVTITANVHRQVAGLFVAEERGRHELKGVPEPVALLCVVRASGGGRRSRQRNLTPLIGRDEDIAMLMRRWQRARQGQGQLVLVIGEPGLGKSRLIEEFLAHVGDTPHTWVEWSCSQLLQNTPLHPIAEWGRQRFGGPDVPAERRLADLESTLAQIRLDSIEIAPLVGPLLDIPLPEDRVLRNLSPEELRRRQLAALTSWVIAGARIQPVVLVFEDLHWADPTTLEVLRGIAERGALAPLFVLATSRPEFKPNWGVRSHHGTINLVPLDRDQVQRMVSQLAARHALPHEIIESLTERTGGVPLFIEEVTRLLLERGAQVGGQVIPPTLQQSLMARLDRLDSARDVAQIGAVIGRGFTYRLLQAVAAMADAPLQATLEQLAEADIVLVQGLPPESDYRFKHALIQDAAYENLLKSRRQMLHRRVAETLRDKFPAMAAAEPEVLAHHFTQAGLDETAIEWWGAAGDQALRRSAFAEAIAHLGKAIAMADNVPTGGAGPQHANRLRLQVSYGNALLSASGYSAAETTAAFARARELASQAENAADRFSAYYGLWVGSFVRGEVEAARDMAEVFLREIEAEPDQPEACVGHRIFGATSWYTGDFAVARRHLEESLSLYDNGAHGDFANRFGQDVAVTALVFLTLTLWPLGEIEPAHQLAEDMVVRAINSEHVATMAYGHCHKAVFELMRRNPSQAAAHIAVTVALARDHGMPGWLAYGNAIGAWARWQSSARDEDLAEMRTGIAQCREQGLSLYIPFIETLLAEQEAEAGEVEAALATVDRAIAETERTGQRSFEAEIHRVRGNILLKQNPADPAPVEEALQRAIAIARRQRARSFELRAALDLAKLYRATRRNADAHTVLALALEGFSPTPEFPQVDEAKRLLAM